MAGVVGRSLIDGGLIGKMGSTKEQGGRCSPCRALAWVRAEALRLGTGQSSSRRLCL
jgi:hypothetical protein